ncbi:SigB/SigF/SigG family RNA polymerase sigma factor [Actinoplanes sp. NPDC049599]|uniref:SigB/SigF/SigG family RNA polymerase sigma factor n=1 Tax=Actinoplanes sp. NPDC049599 TaxID=3363903 RepID=UPI0037A3C7BA
MQASVTRPIRVPRPAEPPLADERGADLIARLSRLAPDDPARPRLRDETIEAWLPLTRRLARRYAGRGEPLDDLIQAATVGLIKAVDRFDAEVGVDFTGFAIPTVLGEIKRHFRDRAWAIRVPRRLQEMRMAISDAGTVLAHRLGRAPTVADLAGYLKVSEEDVLEGLEGARAYSATSLSTPVGAEGGALELGDTLGAEDDDYARTELHLSLGPALECLTERERTIVTLRFFGNQTQTQIAAQIGVSQMHVSRLLSAALVKLRTRLGPDAC